MVAPASPIPERGGDGAATPPASRDSFCFEVASGTEPPPKVDVLVNGLGCERREAYRDLFGPYPAEPVPESALCATMRRVDEMFADDDLVHCHRGKQLLEGLVVYELGSDGDNYQFLVTRRGAGWVILRAFDVVSEGQGNASGWLDGVRAIERTGSAGREVLVDYRTRSIDWDTGSLNFTDNTSCVRLICRGDAGSESCERQFALRTYGGEYEVVKGERDANNWPYRVGLPKSQYDCRASEL